MIKFVLNSGDGTTNIDRNKYIRQEYSVSYLHDQLVSADIKTLLIEDGILSVDTEE